MSWAWAFTDLEGATTALVEPRKVEIQRNLNGPQFTMLELDSDQATGAVHGSLLKGWREPNAGGARVLRSHSQVSEVQSLAGLDALERVSVLTKDAYGMMAERGLIFGLDYVGNTPAVIVNSLIATEDVGRRVTGLQCGSAQTSGPGRDRSYDYGKPYGEIITQLAEVDDGFYFKIDPYDGTNSGYVVFSDFIINYPSSGDTTSVSFEWGEGTLGNIKEVEVTVLPPVNYVTAFGAGEAGAQLYSVQSDTASMTSYGVFDRILSLTDVSEQATLDEHAIETLRPDPIRSYSFKPQEFGPNVPTPWEEFDVGDIVTVRLNGTSPYLQGEFQARVVSFTVEIAADGVERLTEVIVEEF